MTLKEATYILLSQGMKNLAETNLGGFTLTTENLFDAQGNLVYQNSKFLVQGVAEDASGQTVFLTAFGTVAVLTI